MKTSKTLTASLAIGVLSVLGAADADAQYREDSGYLGNRGRPSTVLDLMKQRRAIDSPTVRNPPGAAPIRRPPGFVTDSSTAGTRRAIVSPGAEEPMLPGSQARDSQTRDSQTKEAEKTAPGVAAESTPQFPKPKEPVMEGEAPPEGAPMQAPVEGEAAPAAEGQQSSQPAAQ